MLFQTDVSYLGYPVSRHGIVTDPHKISTVRDWPRPTTVKQVRRFVRLNILLLALYNIDCAHCESIDGHDKRKALFYQARYQREGSSSPSTGPL